MLPFSSERYEQMRDHSLVVRLVTLRDLGVYTCQAYNGLGRAASWSVSLLAYGPVQVQDVEDREYLVYVIDTGRGNYSRVVQPGTIGTTTTTTTQRTVRSEEDYLGRGDGGREGGGEPYLGNGFGCVCCGVCDLFARVVWNVHMCTLPWLQCANFFCNFQYPSVLQ